MLKIAVLVSGGGTNLQALIDSERAGALGPGKIVKVIASRDGVYALERAEKAGIPTSVIARRDFTDAADYGRALIDGLHACGAQLIVLAGFLSILGEEVIRAFPNRIINIHPALIPSFCGKGYYGLRVHEAALEKGVKVTGATVHFVNEIPDGGAIILQKAVPIEEGDTPERLQKRVMEQAEWQLLPQAVRLFCEGKIKVTGNITHITEG